MSVTVNRLEASSFVDHIRLQFENEPTRYDDFITIMKAYKKLRSVLLSSLLCCCLLSSAACRISDLEVVVRICELFVGYPTLVKEFNAFLPNGYRLEPSDLIGGDEAYITLNTPDGVTVYPRDYPMNRSGIGALNSH